MHAWHAAHLLVVTCGLQLLTQLIKLTLRHVSEFVHNACMQGTVPLDSPHVRTRAVARI